MLSAHDNNKINANHNDNSCSNNNHVNKHTQKYSTNTTNKNTNTNNNNHAGVGDKFGGSRRPVGGRGAAPRPPDARSAPASQLMRRRHGYSCGDAALLHGITLLFLLGGAPSRDGHPGFFERTNLSRDNLSREIGRTRLGLPSNDSWYGRRTNLTRRMVSTPEGL